MKISLSILISLLTTFSFACTCTMTPIEEHIRKTDFIVAVEVVQLLDTQKERDDYFFSHSDQSYRVQVKILNNYKGELHINQVIKLGSGFSNCDIYFKDKSKYLLFLRKEGDQYYINYCSYSNHITKAKKSLRAIKKYNKKQRK